MLMVFTHVAYIVFLLSGRAVLSNIEDGVEGGMSWRRGTIGLVDVYVSTPGIFSMKTGLKGECLGVVAPLGSLMST